MVLGRAGAAESGPLLRWLLLALALTLVGCGRSTPTASDPLLVLTPQPTRPTLALPTHASGAAELPRIRSSFDLPTPERTPLLAATRPAGAESDEVNGPDLPAQPPRVGAATPSPTSQGQFPTSAPAATPTPTHAPVLAPTPPVAHRFVLSSRARLYYYCDSDAAWRSLSPVNLRWYDGEQALIADFPGLVLHQPCD